MKSMGPDPIEKSWYYLLSLYMSETNEAKLKNYIYSFILVLFYYEFCSEHFPEAGFNLFPLVSVYTNVILLDFECFYFLLICLP